MPNSSTTPKLRDGAHALCHELYPLNEFPDDLIVRIAGGLVHLMYFNRKDIDGSDWGDIFADAIGGVHFDKPVGIADVAVSNMAWSNKTVKNPNPFNCSTVRLISGRCSPDYSYNISDPHADPEETGRAVLNIWNERVNIAHDRYNPVRTITLIRSEDLTKYTIFEEDTNRFRTSNYRWVFNNKGNLEGFNLETGDKQFVWQPHGSQFTILTKIPEDAIHFTVRRPPVKTKEDILSELHFDSSWVTIYRDSESR